MSTLTIREKLEQREFNNLSDIATKSANATTATIFSIPIVRQTAIQIRPIGPHP